MQLEPGKLDFRAALLLAPTIRDADLLECDGDPYSALLYGTRVGGDAWAALSPNRILGAFGYRKESGKVWSLWSDLSRTEARAVLKHTPLWVTHMVRQSGKPKLHNYVHIENRSAIGWLQASGCFDITWVPTYERGKPTMPCYYFETRTDV